MYEMNGYWTSWSPGVNGNTAPQFVQAWRHIVDIARSQGAKNIRWIWAPNIDSNNPRLSSYESVFPGNSYVDWVGIDGFNWGTSRPTTTWRESSSIFRRSVNEIRVLSAKPLMLAEVASSELGGDKAAWITDAFARIESDFPEISAITWFNAVDPTGGGLARPVVGELAAGVSRGGDLRHILREAALGPGSPEIRIATVAPEARHA